MNLEIAEREAAAKKEKEAAIAYAQELKVTREAERKKKQEEIDARIAQALEEVG